MKLIGLLKAEIVLEDDVDRSGAAHDEDESHDAHQGGHDHRDDRQIGEEPAAGKVVAEQEEGDGDADDRGGDHGGHAQDQGVQQGFEVEGVGEEILEVRDGEGPGLGGEAVVEEPDQGIDQKDDEKGPDGAVAQEGR